MVIRKNQVLLKIASIAIALIIALSAFSGISFADEALNGDEGILTVDLAKSANTGDIIHGAAGFLFGISSEDVPTTNTVVPLKSKIMVTKTAVGTEHPYGDALDIAKTFLESGGEQVQMYNNTYYGRFGASATMYEYCEVLSQYIAPAVVAWKNAWNEEHGTPENPKDNLGAKIDIDKAIVYVPINEGSPGGFDFSLSWQHYHDAIKSVDPNATLAGPNSFYYNLAFTPGQDMASFTQYCADRNCLPEIITWHELETPCLKDMADHIARFKQVWEETDWTLYNKANGTKGTPPIPQICFNEYCDMQHCGVPGRLVNWIARFEDNKVTGCLPFWHNANNLNDLAANANEGNGAWWLYKWYGDMSGTTQPVESSTSYEYLYGLSTMDEAKALSTTLFGGYTGDIIVNLENITKTDSFRREKAVHVTVEETYFTGFNGALDEPTVILDGTYAIEGGDVSIKIPNALFENAYKLTVSLVSEGEVVGEEVRNEVGKVYEAEAGECNLAAEKTKAETSPSFYMSSDRSNGDSIFFGVDMKTLAELTYTINVDSDGIYKLEFIYGNGQGSDRGNMWINDPVNVTQTFSLDGGEPMPVTMESTCFQTMTGIKTLYYELTKGEHKIAVKSGEGINQGMLIHDFLRVTKVDSVGGYNKIFEAEKSDFNTLIGLEKSAVVAKTDIKGYSGSGYVVGLSDNLVSNGGGIRYTVVVPESGLYDVTLRYNAQSEVYANIYVGNTATTLDRIVSSVKLLAGEGWQDASTIVFLQKGINIVDIDASNDCALDYVNISLGDYDDMSVSIEAEDSVPSECRKEIEVIESAGASNGEYVQGILGQYSEPTYLEFKYNAPKAGKYALTVFHSNEDIAGTHWYNIKLTDRYAVFEVNGESDSPVYNLREADEDPRELYYFVDCGDHNTATVTDGEKLGSLNSVTDKIFGKDKSGYSWGLTIMRDDEHEQKPNRKDDTGIYTTFQQAETGSDFEFTDNQFIQDTFIYTNGQVERGIDRYIVYTFELEPGAYDVEVGMANHWFNCDKATVFVESEGVESISQDYKLRDGYYDSRDFTIDLTNAKLNDNGRVELRVRATTEEDCALMTYIKVYEHMDLTVDESIYNLPNSNYVINKSEAPEGLYIGMLDEENSWMIDMRNLKNETDRYFFRNTYSDDTFGEKTIILDFVEGENTVRIYNDNSWNVSYGGSNWAPGTIWYDNYTPNFDKFVITPVAVGNQEIVIYESVKTNQGGDIGAGLIIAVAAVVVVAVVVVVILAAKKNKKAK